MALAGNESVLVYGVSPQGDLAATPEITTTQAIADLAHASGNQTLGNLAVTGISTFTGNTTSGNVSVTKKLIVTGDSIFGNITVNGTSTLLGNTSAGNLAVSAGLGVTGISTFTGNTTAGNSSVVALEFANGGAPSHGFGALAANDLSFYQGGTRYWGWNSYIMYGFANNSQIQLNTDTNPALYMGANSDVIYSRRGNASHLFGATADSATPLAQTFTVPGIIAGTTNTAGVATTWRASASTGNATGGGFTVQVTPAGNAGTSQNVFVNALAVDAQKNVTLGNAAIGTTATDGFIYIPTCAGTPTGTPTTFTGRVPLVYDTTNHQFWIYDSGWKQPKTPAAAALITWQ